MSKMNSLKSMSAYSQAEKNALAESDDPHAMIVVLFDELLRRMRSFVSNLDGDENAIKVRNESYARSLAILHALQGCLDFENGGEIADNLFKLYEYSRYQLLEAFRTGDASKVSSSIHAINELRTAWCEISDERSSDLEVSVP